MAKLIGTAPNQIPTNADLGTMAFVDRDGFDPALNQAIIRKIDVEKSGTPLSIFIYDTTKDSDGGAWRYRTKNTSWYNEEPSEVRGERREFPSLAVIVGYNGGVTIYDGDDPDMPLWMAFRYYGAGTTWSNWGQGLSRGVAAKNGVMVNVGWNGSYGGATITEFITEKGWIFFGTDRKRLGVPLTDRNLTTQNANWWDDKRYNAGLKYQQAASVDMHVVPNAMVDEDTGLPVPHIIIASESSSGGLTLIQDDYRVVHQILSGGDAGNGYIPKNVRFLPDGKLWVGRNTYGTGDRNSDLYQYPNYLVNHDAAYANFVDATTDEGDENEVVYNGNGAVTNAAAGCSGAYDLAWTGGSSPYVALWADSGVTPRQGLIAAIGDDYNSGWMNSDQIFSVLCSTSDADYTGENLITNGTFDSSTTGWSAGPYQATLSVDTNRLKITNGAQSNGRAISTYFPTKVGKKYVAYAYGSDLGTATNFRMEVRAGVEAVASWSSGRGAIEFTAVDDNTYIELYAMGGAGVYVFYDNVEVYEADFDASKNVMHAAIVGNITKEPVAAGAELKAYGGFNDYPSHIVIKNNSLFGKSTGNYAISLWYKHASTNTSKYLFDKANSAGGNRYYALIGTTGYISLSGDVSSNQQMKIGAWTHICFVRRDPDRKTEIWINGELDASGTSNSGWGGTQTDDIFVIGERYSLNNQAQDGKLALFKMYDKALAPETIQKIYRDEWNMFQENSKVTLPNAYGDEVDGFGFDHDEQLLHVCTTEGRSSFRGLTRVDFDNRRTKNVGAATVVAGAKGLIVEG